ncbi:MAG: RagB/SusD family nutrient uptake outer membrane protein [Bacteroidales bacterium]
MKFRNIISGAFGLLLISSCDVLDKEPMDTIGENTFFETADAAAFEQYCNWFYPRLIKGHGDPNNYTLGMLETDYNSDNMYPWNYNTTAFGHHVAPTSKSGTEWQWENLRAANNFLNNYHRSPEKEEAKQRYAGEVMFFKVLDYFNKVRAYGDVPYYDEVLAPGDAALYNPRDSRTLVMEKLLENIDQAIAWLPAKTKVYRVSKDAALALKARMCLYEGTWRRYHNIEGDVEFLEAAYDAAGVLMSGEFNYALHEGSSPAKSYYELFIQEDYNSSTEVILSKEYDPKISKGHNISRELPTGVNPFGMSKDMADSYLCAETGLPVSQCECHKDETGLIASMKNRDPRMLQTVALPEEGDFTYYLEGSKSVISNLIGSGKGATSTGYAVVKFYNKAEDLAAHNQGTSDAPIFRFAEILLIRAEAGAELGKDPELDRTINALRRRVGFNVDLTNAPFADPALADMYPNVKGANANLIREIRRERRIELFGEGLRRDDLMRWASGEVLAKPRKGMILDETLYTSEEIATLKRELGVFADGSLDVYGKRVQMPAEFIAPKHYLYAIPINEIALNPNLEQNPGW